MRNIYDIISEHRTLIDVKFASHDLEYTNDYFINNQEDYYVQEGLGEGIKNGVQKVLEFIRSIIEKIKNLFSKIRDFFSKRRNGKEDFKETLDKMADKDNGGGSSNNDTKPSENNAKDDAEDKKDGKPSTNKNSGSQYYKYKSGSKPQSFRMFIENSLRTVSSIRYASLKTKSDVSENFFSVIMSVAGNFAGAYDHANKKMFLDNIEKRAFKGDGSYKKLPDADMTKRIQAEIHESNEAEEIKVADMAELIEEYYYQGTDQIQNNLKGWCDKSNEFLKEVENKLKRFESEGQDKSADLANVQKVSGMVSSFMSVMPSNIVKTYSALETIYKQVKADALAAYGTAEY